MASVAANPALQVPACDGRREDCEELGADFIERCSLLQIVFSLQAHPEFRRAPKQAENLSGT
jgi:hypothetical protein